MSEVYNPLVAKTVKVGLFSSGEFLVSCNGNTLTFEKTNEKVNLPDSENPIKISTCFMHQQGYVLVSYDNSVSKLYKFNRENTGYELDLVDVFDFMNIPTIYHKRSVETIDSLLMFYIEDDVIHQMMYCPKVKSTTISKLGGVGKDTVISSLVENETTNSLEICLFKRNK